MSEYEAKKLAVKIIDSFGVVTRSPSGDPTLGCGKWLSVYSLQYNLYTVLLLRRRWMSLNFFTWLRAMYSEA
jgi:hypothetical protein